MYSQEDGDVVLIKLEMMIYLGRKNARFTLDGKMQDETRAMTRTRLTPMAEYQIDETSYKSVKIKLQLLQKLKKFLKSKYVQLWNDEDDGDNRGKDDMLANPIKVVRWPQKKRERVGNKINLDGHFQGGWKAPAVGHLVGRRRCLTRGLGDQETRRLDILLLS